MKKISLILALAFVSFALAENRMNDPNFVREIQQGEKQRKNKSKEQKQREREQAIADSKKCHIVCRNGQSVLYYGNVESHGIENCMASNESIERIKRQSESCGK